MKKIIILGCNADIGRHMAIFFSKKKCKIIGSYRKKSNFKNYQNIDVVKCNLNQQKDILKHFTQKNFNWD